MSESEKRCPACKSPLDLAKDSKGKIFGICLNNLCQWIGKELPARLVGKDATFIHIED